MWVLPLLGYIGLILGFLFLTLSIASGLYYLSELVEEHSVLSCKLLKRLIYVVIASLTLLLLVDGFPWHITFLSIISHMVYYQNLRHFPYVKLTDPVFLLSGVLVVLNHWVWFRFFSSPDAFTRKAGGWFGVAKGPPAGSRGNYYNPYNQPSFTEVASYFGLCIWLVPFALFVSLSAGENVLPSMGSEYATGHLSSASTPVVDSASGGFGAQGGLQSLNSGPGFRKGHKRRNTGMAKAAVANVREWIGENGAVMGWWKRDNVRGF